MTTPDEAEALMRVATTVMSPEEIADHCVGLAKQVALLDEHLAEIYRYYLQPYAGVESEYPNAYGLVTLIEAAPNG